MIVRKSIPLFICSAVVAISTLVQAQAVYTPAPAPIIVGLPAGATYPQVVSSNPRNGDNNVSTNVRQVTINFDQPMNTTTFYWTVPNTNNFPPVTGQAYWTNGNKTFVIPVALQMGVTYQIPLNVTDQLFKSAQGVPLSSGYVTFTTGNSSNVQHINTGNGATRLQSVGGVVRAVPQATAVPAGSQATTQRTATVQRSAVPQTSLKTVQQPSNNGSNPVATATATPKYTPKTARVRGTTR